MYVCMYVFTKLSAYKIKQKIKLRTFVIFEGVLKSVAHMNPIRFRYNSDFTTHHISKLPIQRVAILSWTHMF